MTGNILQLNFLSSNKSFIFNLVRYDIALGLANAQGNGTRIFPVNLQSINTCGVWILSFSHWLFINGGERKRQLENNK